MILPLLFFIASAAFSAPTALSSVQTESLNTPETLGVYVRQYFADKPVLANIAWCESRMRHLGKDGEIFVGKIDSDDTGIMQINTRYHEKRATELGYDIYSLSGNLGYAQYLYEKEGTRPWLSSSPCFLQKTL